MQISEKQLRQFKDIYTHQYGQEINEEKAFELAHALVVLMHEIYSE